MKKIAVVIMFFSFCGGSDQTIEPLITTATSTTSTTTREDTTTTSTTSTTTRDEDTTTISTTDTQSINNDCPEKLLFDTPVDLNLVTSILYPGQIRANYFKPHGGFRFDGLGDNNNKITVKIPIDSFLVLGSRYVVEGQVQYMFEFNTACNVNLGLTTY